MHAVEFETVIHDDVIHVPERYHEFEHKKIRVMLIDAEKNREYATLPEGFYQPLRVASYNLAAREEIYDRQRLHP